MERGGAGSGGGARAGAADEASRVEERSSILTSLLGLADGAFLGEVGTTQIVKPGYQTAESGVR